MGFLEDVQNLTIEEKFYKWLPDTLYQSHYKLAEAYGHTPQEWRKFLRDNHTFIETELAAIGEAEARSALSRLGTASGNEVTALKAILEKSKLINDAQKQNTKVVLTFIPNSEEDLNGPNNRNISDSAPIPNKSISKIIKEETNGTHRFSSTVTPEYRSATVHNPGSNQQGLNKQETWPDGRPKLSKYR